MERRPSSEATPERAERWEFLRDVIVFQAKLLLDAVRDLVLSPVSLVAAAFDLVTGGDRPGRHFYRVLAAGGRMDAWINLFGKPGDTARRESGERQDPTVDALVDQVERLIVDQYERGGVTASAKATIDRSLDVIARGKDRR